MIWATPVRPPMEKWFGATPGVEAHGKHRAAQRDHRVIRRGIVSFPALQPSHSLSFLSFLSLFAPPHSMAAASDQRDLLIVRILVFQQRAGGGNIPPAVARQIRRSPFLPAEQTRAEWYLGFMSAVTFTPWVVRVVFGSSCAVFTISARGSLESAHDLPLLRKHHKVHNRALVAVRAGQAACGCEVVR